LQDKEDPAIFNEKFAKAMTEAATKKVVHTKDQEGRSVTRLVDPSDLTTELAIGVWETHDQLVAQGAYLNPRQRVEAEAKLIAQYGQRSELPNATDLVLAALDREFPSINASLMSMLDTKLNAIDDIPAAIGATIAEVGGKSVYDKMVADAKQGFKPDQWQDIYAADPQSLRVLAAFGRDVQRHQVRVARIKGQSR
jgi:hypothetical protein